MCALSSVVGLSFVLAPQRTFLYILLVLIKLEIAGGLGNILCCGGSASDLSRYSVSGLSGVRYFQEFFTSYKCTRLCILTQNIYLSLPQGLRGFCLFILFCFFYSSLSLGGGVSTCGLKTTVFVAPPNG